MYTPSTYTYLIHLVDTDKYKIGQSKNPYKRLKALQTGSANKLKLLTAVYSDKWFEGRIHRMLGLSHYRGEWFTLDLDTAQWLIQYMEEREFKTVEQDIT